MPILFVLKRHRKIWINQKDNDVDLEKFRKNARKLLNTCISLGPVYIKLGQWLSSRADILPQPYMKELGKLQDDVPSAPFEQIKPILEKDLGPIEQNFDFIDHNVLSGASIGQVYRARVNDQEVVVKVKRPGIEKKIEEDVKVLKKFLPIGLKFVDPNLGFTAKSMLSQFIETIYEELDYTLESSNLKKIKKNLIKNKRVIIPRVFDEYCSKNIITMEYLPGIKITDVEALDAKGIDRKQLVDDVHMVFFTMLLHHSLFHADPHPGNISVNENGKIILYDFGMTGKLNRETRMRLVRLYLGLIEKDPPRTVTAMDELGMLKPDYNRPLIEKAISMSIRAMHGKKPDEVEIDAFMELANKTMGKFPFVLPKELALYLRMASILEGIYHTHKVDFKFVKVLRTLLEQENLMFDAYLEELKFSFNKIAKSIDDAISLAPELRRFLDENRSLQWSTKKPKSNGLLAGSIFSSTIFIGSSFLFSSNEFVGMAGMVGSIIIFGVVAKFSHR
ncbi:MAG TPA: AarF/UbiB family protein [Nitrosopumilaceae archaeon]|nr:AarF/UbiB family protein [Nitrosopumilaceae archaeon]